MKNIHLIPTEKPSRLWINNLLQGKLELSKEVLKGSNTAQHICISNDEEIREGDWVFDSTNYGLIHKVWEVTKTHFSFIEVSEGWRSTSKERPKLDSNGNLILIKL
jgi:hypothetical protein